MQWQEHKAKKKQSNYKQCINKYKNGIVQLYSEGTQGGELREVG